MFGSITCNNQENFVTLHITGSESAFETFFNIFDEKRAEILSQGHGWTEGPVLIPKDPPNIINDILYFSDTIHDKIWMYEESEFEPNHRFTVVVENSGSCESARSDCHLVAEPGSNGLAFDEINNNLLICQHGARAIIKLPLDAFNGMPIASDLEVRSKHNKFN